MTMLLALLAAGPAFGPIKTFGNWVVACDNIRRCEATSLPYGEDDSQVGNPDTSWSIVREPGPGGKVSIMAFTSTKAADILVDGKAVAKGVNGGDVLRVAGDPAMAAVRAMANGARASVGGEDVSLAGMSAALRFIDAEQGRAGSVDAIVARGVRPASSVLSTAALPVVPYLRPPAGSVSKITPALRTALDRAMPSCREDEGDGDRPIEMVRLDARTQLALVPCGAGAYNFSSAAFVVVGGIPRAAKFDLAPEWGEPGSTPLLVNAGFDEKTGQLSSFAKGRGLGDCGNSESYVWDGAMFRIVEARKMLACRGSTNWMTVWRARPVAR